MSDEEKGKAMSGTEHDESKLVVETEVIEINYAVECYNMRQVLHMDLAALRLHAGVDEASQLRRSYDSLQTVNGIRSIEIDSSRAGHVHAIVGLDTADSERFTEYKYDAVSGGLNVAKRSQDGEIVATEESAKDDLRGFQHTRNLAGIIFDCDTQERRQS